MIKIILTLILTSFAFLQNRDCMEITNPEECYDMGCEWITLYQEVENELILTEGCFDPNEDWDDEDENHEYDLPECLLDCDGIEYLNPEDGNPYETCDWIISNFGPNNFMNPCLEDCDNETMMDINEYVELCFQCLSDNNCDDIFDNENDENSECYGLGYEDCEYLDFCEWIIDSDNPSSDGFCTYVNDHWDDEDDCDPDLACATVITCYDGLLYPTACGPENCDDPIGECDDNYEGCQGEDGQWYDFGYEMFTDYCNYYECTPNGWIGPFTLDNDNCSDNEDWECSDLDYEDCIQYDFCEWVLTNNFDAGFCVDAEDDNDGPPECAMDCEGIEDANPEENGTYFCEWLLDIFPTGCAEDCDQETLDEIEEFMNICDECMPNNSCEDAFNNDEEGCYEDGEWYCYGCEMFINDCEYYECTEEGWQGPFESNNDECYDNWDCAELNYQECIDSEECEWMITTPNGGYSCVETDIENNCNDLNYQECLNNPNCEPNFNATGEFEGCDDFNNQQNFGLLYGTVSYIYGDVVDFVSYASIYIESLPSNADIYYFEVMTDEDGFYQIELPVGAYMVTAYANEESLTLDAQIVHNSEFELNFLIGDWDGPWYPYAELSLGDYHTTVPGGEVILPLYLSSNEFVGGVQYTIGLNEPGLTLIGIESTDPCFSADFNMIDDLQSIGIIFSLEGCSYPPEEMLEIANMLFSVSPVITVGSEFEVFFNNTIVSDAVGNEIPSYGEGTVIMIGTQGDVNGDGELNVLDIVMMINFAIYVEEPNDLELWASDLNNDGLVNILDIVILVNLILND